MTQGTRFGAFSLVVAVILAVVTLAALAQNAAPAAPPKSPAAVPVATLQTFIPQIEGWTRGPLGGTLVEISPTAGYTTGTASFTNGQMKVRLTVADSLGVDECLMALAATVTILPAGYTEKVPPSTLITRFVFDGFQAASTWDSDKLDGDFSVVVNGRFVVSAEGVRLDAVDTLRSIISKVDLKRLGEFKPGQ